MDFKDSRLASAKQLGDHKPLQSHRSAAKSTAAPQDEDIPHIHECSQPHKRSMNHFFVFNTNKTVHAKDEIPAKAFTKLPADEGIVIKPRMSS